MITKIPIEIVELEGDGYHLFIECTFNSKEKGNLIIDTGASKTVFDKNFLLDFSTDIDFDVDIKSAGIDANPIENSTGIIKKISLGELDLNNFMSVFIDLSQINEIYKEIIDKKIWGLLGSDLLKKFDGVIDYKNKTLTLKFRKNSNY